MTNLKLSHFCLFVGDQDEALAFYTKKLGFEKRADVPFGDMRWLTVGSPDQPDLELVLIDAGVRPDIAEDVRDLMARGGMNGVIWQTADCRADYARLSAAGVEFTGEPEEHFYGIDVGFRDPFGNMFRLTQPAENMVLPDGATMG
jgi:catechol 2,3-dioxygenase-like lactoylglutathione lyase family enzyme